MSEPYERCPALPATGPSAAVGHRRSPARPHPPAPQHPKVTPVSKRPLHCQPHPGLRGVPERDRSSELPKGNNGSPALGWHLRGEREPPPPPRSARCDLGEPRDPRPATRGQAHGLAARDTHRAEAGTCSQAPGVLPPWNPGGPREWDAVLTGPAGWGLGRYPAAVLRSENRHNPPPPPQRPQPAAGSGGSPVRHRDTPPASGKAVVVPGGSGRLPGSPSRAPGPAMQPEMPGDTPPAPLGSGGVAGEGSPGASPGEAQLGAAGDLPLRCLPPCPFPSPVSRGGGGGGREGGPGEDSPAVSSPAAAERPRAPGRSGRAPRSAAGPEPAAAGPVGGILRPGLPGAPRPRTAPPGGPDSAEHPRPSTRSFSSSPPRPAGEILPPVLSPGASISRRDPRPAACALPAPESSPEHPRTSGPASPPVLCTPRLYPRRLPLSRTLPAPPQTPGRAGPPHTLRRDRGLHTHRQPPPGTGIVSSGKPELGRGGRRAGGARSGSPAQPQAAQDRGSLDRAGAPCCTGSRRPGTPEGPAQDHGERPPLPGPGASGVSELAETPPPPPPPPPPPRCCSGHHRGCSSAITEGRPNGTPGCRAKVGPSPRWSSGRQRPGPGSPGGRESPALGGRIVPLLGEDQAVSRLLAWISAPLEQNLPGETRPGRAGARCPPGTLHAPGGRRPGSSRGRAGGAAGAGTGSTLQGAAASEGIGGLAHTRGQDARLHLAWRLRGTRLGEPSVPSVPSSAVNSPRPKRQAGSCHAGPGVLRVAPAELQHGQPGSITLPSSGLTESRYREPEEPPVPSSGPRQKSCKPSPRAPAPLSTALSPPRAGLSRCCRDYSSRRAAAVGWDLPRWPPGAHRGGGERGGVSPGPAEPSRAGPGRAGTRQSSSECGPGAAAPPRSLPGLRSRPAVRWGPGWRPSSVPGAAGGGSGRRGLV
ncbi:collagen alpha-1(III) chain-like [Pogoniulus pusillus]|uniref:collagen alpha-1(III) chain-like n=1 Tax=Pogoniulus pusillus TaxID=488313 RepID=UPI0030B962A1